MHMRASVAASVLVSLLALMSACGGNKPADSAADADANTEDAKSAEKSGDDSSSEAKADEKADEKKPDEKKPDEKKPDEGPKASRTPEDILKAPDTVFLFSFNDSEPKQVAEEKCTKKAGDDPKKMNQCMAGERKKFEPTGHRFKLDEKQQWWWITVRQVGNRLVTVKKTPVEFAEQSDTSVTLKPKDKGSGVVFEVPNDYQIALKDPKHGRLVFQAKVGSVQE
jgi:hypothetical protein